MKTAFMLILSLLLAPTQIAKAQDSECLKALQMFKEGITEATSSQVAEDIETIFQHEWEQFQSQASRDSIASKLKFMNAKGSVGGVFDRSKSKDEYNTYREYILNLVRSNRHSEAARNFSHDFMPERINMQDFINCIEVQSGRDKGVSAKKIIESYDSAVIAVKFARDEGHPTFCTIVSIKASPSNIELCEKPIVVGDQTVKHLTIPLDAIGEQLVTIQFDSGFSDRTIVVGQKRDPESIVFQEINSRISRLEQAFDARSRKYVTEYTTGEIGSNRANRGLRHKVTVPCPPGANLKTGIWSVRFDRYDNMPGVGALCENIRYRAPDSTLPYGAWEGDVVLVTNGGMPANWDAIVRVVIVWDEMPAQ